MRSSTRSITQLLAAVTLLGVAAGCGSDDDTATTSPSTVPATTMPATTTPETTMPDTTDPDPTAPSTSVPDQQPAPVSAAISDLVERTGRDAGEISVATFEDVTWRDGSIGCPEPGVSYTQALVPGYRIELTVDGASWWYHGARDGDQFWCENPTDPVEGEAGDR